MIPESIPSTCDIAFKEWAGVCDALADGRQSLILRKGGIAEDAGEFRPEHSTFWLYPTHLHESQQGLRDDHIPRAEGIPPGRLDLPALTQVECVVWVDRPELLEGIADLHVWTSETVLKRFQYRNPGLWVLGVRVFRADPPPRILVTSEQNGCKSWVSLDEPVGTNNVFPTVDDETLNDRLQRIRALSASDRGGQ
ncbi:DUF1802 family protein [Tautonia rosea]|uniref:DUF1802 family protein n=1 Tax=Tautonia rosea TaxID=2728037 RepID=UPI001472EED0|nr:DUF1802 family protein [Tautonia rosea]